MTAGKSFEDDDVELICTKSGLGSLQALTDALAATDSSDQQQSLLQVWVVTAHILAVMLLCCGVQATAKQCNSNRDATAT